MSGGQGILRTRREGTPRLHLAITRISAFPRALSPSGHTSTVCLPDARDVERVVTMPISKRLRFEILRRDGFKCVYCGAAAADSELHVDHVEPVSLGGDDSPGNLVACCIDCNRGKASTSADAKPDLPDDYKAAAVAAQLTREKREAAIAEETALVAEIQDEFKSYWAHPSVWPYANVVRSWLQDFTVTELKEFIEMSNLKCRTQGSAVRYLNGMVRTARARREGRVQTCSLCGKWVHLPDGYDPTQSWVHDKCARVAADLAKKKEDQA